MKRSLIYLFILFLTTSINAQGIEFLHGSWEDALDAAKEEDKIIFVDAYAKWCGPCKRMAKEVFTKKEVGTFFNDNFINIKLDMEESHGISFGQNERHQGQ